MHYIRDADAVLMSSLFCYYETMFKFTFYYLIIMFVFSRWIEKGRGIETCKSLAYNFTFRTLFIYLFIYLLFYLFIYSMGFVFDYRNMFLL